MLFHTDDKLADEVTLKNVVISIAYIINDVDEFYTEIYLEDILLSGL